MAGTDYARIELYRDTVPTFHPNSRVYLGPIKMVAHPGGWESGDEDTPCVLTDNINRNSYNVTNNTLYTYYDGAGITGLMISPSIPQALKGAMRDSTVYGNHGDSAGIGGPTEIFGMIGGGYNNDGVDEYMVVEKSNSLNLTNALTMETWVKLDTSLSTQPHSNVTVLAKRIGTTGYMVGFNKTNQLLIVDIGSNHASTDVSSIDWTKWHQITITYDGTKIQMYVDSLLIHSQAATGTIGVNTANLCIGDLSHRYGFTLDGSVDEIRLSDTAQSWEGINTSYNNQKQPNTFYVIGTRENVTLIVHTYTIPLHASWNLISLPFNETKAKTSISVRYNNVLYSWIDAVNGGIILNTFYDWDRTGQNYVISDSLSPGRGYWSWSYNDCDLIFSSTVVEEVNLGTLKSGWNIMSLPLNTSLAKSNLIVRYNNIDYSWTDATNGSNPIIIGYIYSWDRSNQLYLLSDLYSPGHGYWMYAYKDCILKKGG
jgi:hypothetical protein